MFSNEIHSRCRKLVNQPVEIRCRDGSVHRGTLTKVDDRFAYVQPFEPGLNDGPGLFVWGYGYGGFGVPIALTAIVAIAAIGLFW
ncbi:hypothetical protein EWH99_02905 [Sporolactobacillus sp. THM7-7]|nr:hypothetical protein EWH99_02905 [Sporolactobacillus sp. THM7-7]